MVNKNREVCQKWSKAVERLALELLGLISLSLGLPATHFHQHWKGAHMSAIRLNYYPVCPHPDVVLGVSRHKDPGALTVLVQDEVGGLEVRRKDGEWVGVQPRRDAFVINVGDAFQVYSRVLSFPQMFPSQLIIRMWLCYCIHASI